MARYTVQMQRIANEYLAKKPRASTEEIADWAIKNERWRPHPAAIRRQCAEDLARAMREEYITDRYGRRVRAKHVARVVEGGKQMSLWADIRTAPRQHMVVAFGQRRQQIVGDCRQLKLDVDSFNATRSQDRPIPMVFDFTSDLAEADALAKRA
jgi:hypothetical protein